MEILKKTTAGILLLFMVHFGFPKLHLALADQLPAVKATVTEHEPEGRTTAEVGAPQKSGGGGKWLWALLGVALIGGAAAAAGGGGGGGGGGDDGGESTGSFEASW